MKPYGKNDKIKNFRWRNSKYYCGCWLCEPVKKGTKKSTRHKAKLFIKKEIKRVAKGN